MCFRVSGGVCSLSGAASPSSVRCLISVTGTDAHSCDLCFQNTLCRQFSPLQTIKLFSVVLAGDTIGWYPEICASVHCGRYSSLDPVESKSKLKLICRGMSMNYLLSSLFWTPCLLAQDFLNLNSRWRSNLAARMDVSTSTPDKLNVLSLHEVINWLWN